MSTPDLELETGFILGRRGRIVSTREPRPSRGPMFVIVRSATHSAWAIRDDLPDAALEELSALARAERPCADLRMPPRHAAQYLALTGGHLGFNGPAFTFPEGLSTPPGVVLVEDERSLQHNFPGWESGELAEGRAPVLPVLEGGHPLSLCCCARSSEVAAAAGLETAERFRGRGFGTRVTAAWAVAIRATGRVPLYSAAWSNAASLAVTHKLRLTAHASFWSVAE